MMQAKSAQKGRNLNWRRLDLRRLARVESGASYSLSYVMAMPLYTMFLLLILQCALLLMAKIGVVYASYAAARAAAVWSSARSSTHMTPGGRMEQKARQAALLALAPFASGAQHHQVAGGGGAAPWVAPYQKAAQEWGPGAAISDEYLAVKLRNAAQGLRPLSIRRLSDDSGGLIEVTLRYEAPYLIPWLGRLMGSGTRGGVAYHLIESTATLPCEDPRGGGQEIGIEYVSE